MVTAIVAVLALVTFVLAAVVIELYRDVRQLRELSGVIDRPLDVEMDDVAGTSPSTYSLPKALDSASAAIVLFLSDRCATCHALAAGFNGALAPGLWVVLEARTPDATNEFLGKHGFTAASTKGRLVVDLTGEIAERIGLRTTPVGFRVQNGKFVSATTVPSRRYLSSILPNRVQLERFSTASPPSASPKKERAHV